MQKKIYSLIFYRQIGGKQPSIFMAYMGHFHQSQEND